MSKMERPTFLELASIVDARATQFFARTFPELPIEVDYMSVYPKTADEYASLCAEASDIGEPVGRKNGKVFLLEEMLSTSGLHSRIVRVRNENPDDELLGCADFVVADFEAAVEQAQNLPNSQTFHKQLGTAKYDIVEVKDPSFGVSIYVPSLRMTHFMGA